MTNDSSQEALRIIYEDEFLKKPQNRHYRDQLIKKLILRENELLDMKLHSEH